MLFSVNSYIEGLRFYSGVNRRMTVLPAECARPGGAERWASAQVVIKPFTCSFQNVCTEETCFSVKQKWSSGLYILIEVDLVCR